MKTKTIKSAPWEIQKGRWGYDVVVNDEAIESFDTRQECNRFMDDFEAGRYHGSEYAERVQKALNKA